MIAVAALQNEMQTAPERRQTDTAPELSLFVGCGRRTPGLVEAFEARRLRGVGTERAREGLLQAQRLRPDLVLIGTDLDGLEPSAFLRDMALAAPESLRLYLADRSEPDLATEALEAGAHDVVTPPHAVGAILVRAAIVDRRGLGVREDHPRRWRAGPVEVDLDGRRVWDGSDPVSLSGREYELLARLLESRGQVVTRERLLEDIWGDDQGNDAVLDATVHRLRRKLERKHTSPRVLTTVRGVGYRLEMVEARR